MAVPERYRVEQGFECPWEGEDEDPSRSFLQQEWRSYLVPALRSRSMTHSVLSSIGAHSVAALIFWTNS